MKHAGKALSSVGALLPKVIPPPFGIGLGFAFGALGGIFGLNPGPSN